MSATTIKIRPAEPSDSASLLNLMYQHAEYEQAPQPSISIDKLRALITENSKIQLWVATNNQTLLGYFSLTQDYATWSGKKYLHLDCLFLAQAHRKQGIGTQLFAQIKRVASALNIQQIQWQTPIENASGIDFYQRQGGTYKIKSRFSLELP